MSKCSFFVRLACVALALVLGVSSQEYDVEEPTNENEGVVFRTRDAEETGVRSDNALIFDDSEIVVNPGEQLNLDCGVQGTIRYCLWELGSDIYQVEDIHENVYPGMSAPMSTEGNECGIVINAANIEHHGKWTCKVLVKGNSLVGEKQVIVTIKPTSPMLEVDNVGGYMEVTNEEPTEVKCSVAAARPAVGMHWYLGNKDITSYAQKEETPTDEGGIYKSVSTLRHSFKPEENGNVLVCSITHQTLAAPENASIPVSVIFKPLEKEVTTFYQIKLGSEYDVSLNFSANPVPTRTEWKFGDSPQNMIQSIPVPGTYDRYTTDLIDQGNGIYTAKLRIAAFTEEDANQQYKLTVENRLGETHYAVRLSMDEAPLDTLGGGAVAGIVIVVLIVVVAVVGFAYTRYRQMFCFAPAAAADPEEGKDIKEEHSDTESARGPNTTRAANLKNSIGKLTQVFKKPKKDQDTKLEEGIADDEKKYLTKEEQKESPKKEQSGGEKELPGQTQIPEETQIPVETTQSYTNSDVKPTELQKEQTEGKTIESNVTQPSNEQKTAKPVEKNEVVYAELDLSKGESEKKADIKSEDKTEYAQIIGTVTDNREEEKKE